MRICSTGELTGGQAEAVCQSYACLSVCARVYVCVYV